MIEVDRLHKQYGPVAAVRGVSFRVEPGSVVGLLGPNGAGKSTTIRILTGYVPATSGSARVFGADSQRDSVVARGNLGYLPESAPLPPEMRAHSYLHHRGKLYGLRGRKLHDAIEKNIARCGLSGYCSKRIGRLSKGYRQRVGLASSLLHDPPALVLDEPASGLDPAQIAQTRELVRGLASEGKAVLLSSHFLPEVEASCDRAVVMVNGSVRADADLRTLAASVSSGPCVYELECQPLVPHAPIDPVSALAPVLSPHGRVTGSHPLADGWTRLTVTASSGVPDLREPLARAASAHGLLLRELRRDRPSLEGLFLSLLGSDATPASVQGSFSSGSRSAPSLSRPNPTPRAGSCA